MSLLESVSSFFSHNSRLPIRPQQRSRTIDPRHQAELVQARSKISHLETEILGLRRTAKRARIEEAMEGGKGAKVREQERLHHKVSAVFTSTVVAYRTSDTRSSGQRSINTHFVHVLQRHFPCKQCCRVKGYILQSRYQTSLLPSSSAQLLVLAVNT